MSYVEVNSASMSFRHSKKVNFLLEFESMAGFRALFIFHIPNLCQPEQ